MSHSHHADDSCSHVTLTSYADDSCHTHTKPMTDVVMSHSHHMLMTHVIMSHSHHTRQSSGRVTRCSPPQLAGRPCSYRSARLLAGGGGTMWQCGSGWWNHVAVWQWVVEPCGSGAVGQWVVEPCDSVAVGGGTMWQCGSGWWNHVAVGQWGCQVRHTTRGVHLVSGQGQVRGIEPGPGAQGQGSRQ